MKLLGQGHLLEKIGTLISFKFVIHREIIGVLLSVHIRFVIAVEWYDHRVPDMMPYFERGKFRRVVAIPG